MKPRIEIYEVETGTVIETRKAPREFKNPACYVEVFNQSERSTAEGNGKEPRVAARLARIPRKKRNQFELLEIADAMFDSMYENSISGIGAMVAHDDLCKSLGDTLGVGPLKFLSFALYRPGRPDKPGNRFGLFFPTHETFGVLMRIADGYGEQDGFRLGIYPSDYGE